MTKSLVHAVVCKRWGVAQARGGGTCGVGRRGCQGSQGGLSEEKHHLLTGQPQAPLLPVCTVSERCNNMVPCSHFNVVIPQSNLNTLQAALEAALAECQDE
jgi:hypothetical protein